METLSEFTDAGLRSILTLQSHAITELSRQVEVLTEQAVISAIQIGELESAIRRGQTYV